jgi:hypothetical protein
VRRVFLSTNFRRECRQCNIHRAVGASHSGATIPVPMGGRLLSSYPNLGCSTTLSLLTLQKYVSGCISILLFSFASVSVLSFANHRAIIALRSFCVYAQTAVFLPLSTTTTTISPCGSRVQSFSISCKCTINTNGSGVPIQRSRARLPPGYSSRYQAILSCKVGYFAFYVFSKSNVKVKQFIFLSSPGTEHRLLYPAT